jgi:hypothetical protein
MSGLNALINLGANSPAGQANQINIPTMQPRPAITNTNQIATQTLNNQMQAGSSSNLGVGGNNITDIASALPMVLGLVAGGKNRNEANKANDKAMQLAKDLENFKRQTPTNPFANMTNYASNLAVATQAAEIKAREADQSLANTLDTIRATGLGAGGATALAQAAAKAKQGVAADIEKQEAANQSLMAKGEADRQMMIGKGEQFRQQLVDKQEETELEKMAGLANFYGNVAGEQRAASESKAAFGQAAGKAVSGYLKENPELLSKITEGVGNLFGG